jgi:hypothetical protein
MARMLHCLLQISYLLVEVPNSEQIGVSGAPELCTLVVHALKFTTGQFF